MKRRQARPRVFLSHSGFDADYAITLATTLKQRLSDLGYDIEVFNTSEPEYRFKDLRAAIMAGDDFRAVAEQYDRELRAYLERKLKESTLFLALVTANSLAAPAAPRREGMVDFGRGTLIRLPEESPARGYNRAL